MGDDSHFVFHQKLLGEDGSVRRGVVMVQQPKFEATSLHAKHCSRTWNSQFGLWDKFFVHNPLDVKGDDHAFDIAFHLSGLLWPW